MLSRVWSDYRRGFGLDLSTNYTHNSELQVSDYNAIANLHALPSLQHTISFFQPAVSSPAFPGYRLLTVEILQLPGSSPLSMAAPFQLSLFFKDSRSELTWLPPLFSL
jgi:hypothetical protein